MFNGGIMRSENAKRAVHVSHYGICRRVIAAAWIGLILASTGEAADKSEPRAKAISPPKSTNRAKPAPTSKSSSAAKPSTASKSTSRDKTSTTSKPSNTSKPPTTPKPATRDKVDDVISQAIKKATDTDFALETRLEALKSLSANYLNTNVPLVTSSSRMKERPADRVLPAIEPLFDDPDLGYEARNVAISYGRNAEAVFNKTLAKKKTPDIVRAMHEASCSLRPENMAVVESMLKQTSKRVEAMNCLYVLKQTGTAADAATPTLRELIDRHNKGPLRERTFGTYGSQDSDLADIQAVAVEVLAAVTKDQQACVPFVIKTMQEHRFIEVRLAALSALGTMGPNAKAAVPALRTLLTRFESNRQHQGIDMVMIAERVIGTLGAIGPDASDALPELRRFLKDPTLAKPAEGAIQRIKSK